MLERELPRRRALQLGGLAVLAPFIPQFLAAQPAAAAVAGGFASAAGGGIPQPELSPKALWYGAPATDWESQALPIGNGRLGAMLFGNPDEEVVQFNEQSLWGGVNDYDNALAGQPDGAFDTGMMGFGSYRNFGTLKIAFGARPEVTSPGGPYQISGSERLENTYDGSPSTKWCIIGPPAHVIWQAQLPTPAVVTSYSFTSANDVPARDPQDWTVLGSNDGSTWSTLDTRSVAPFEQRLQTKTFQFQNATAYRFYRIDIVPKAGVSHFQVGEIALGGVDLAQGGNVYVSSPSGHEASLVGSIDGEASTVWQVDDAGDGAIWQLELGSKRALTGYALMSAVDEPAFDPSAWTLAASNDGVAWQTLDARNAVTFAGRGETKAFTFSNSTAYSLYRLTFTAFLASSVCQATPSFDAARVQALGSNAGSSTALMSA